MKEHPQLIVMLTHDDMTVPDAAEVFEGCRNSKAGYFGFKEEPLPPADMKKLFSEIREAGKKTVLEVVAYTEEEGIRGARLAADCGCDILMGTMYFDSVLDICRSSGMKYMPYVGRITGRPSVLGGTPEEMIAQARECIEKGAYGIDLLGYRYTGDAAELNRRFVAETGAPVCLAGSVNSIQRLDEVKAASPWAFTIGSAFFDNVFGGTVCEQIDRVCEYMSRP